MTIPVQCSGCGEKGRDEFPAEPGPGRARVTGRDGWWLELVLGQGAEPLLITHCPLCVDLIRIQANES